MLIIEKKWPVHLPPCKYRSTAKHIDGSHIRICVIYNCRYAFVLFNEKCICEFKNVTGFILAVIWYFSIYIISWWSGYKLHLMALKLLVAEICKREGSFCLCTASSFLSLSNRHWPLSDLWPDPITAILCIYACFCQWIQWGWTRQ